MYGLHCRLQVMSAESEWHAKKQTSFKQKISDTSGLNTRRFDDAEEVCEKIKTDLLACIEADFPVGSEPTQLEREREAHDAFAEARRRVYVGRDEYFNEISAFMSKHLQQPLVVLGRSGSGKSAFIANWSGRMEEAHRDAFVFVHFIGSSAESASYIKLIRRFANQHAVAVWANSFLLSLYSPDSAPRSNSSSASRSRSPPSTANSCANSQPGSRWRPRAGSASSCSTRSTNWTTAWGRRGASMICCGCQKNYPVMCTWFFQRCPVA